MSATTIAVATSTETVGPPSTCPDHPARAVFEAIISVLTPVPGFDIGRCRLAPSPQFRPGSKRPVADDYLSVFYYLIFALHRYLAICTLRITGDRLTIRTRFHGLLEASGVGSWPDLN